jgi:hypothetical protein
MAIFHSEPKFLRWFNSMKPDDELFTRMALRHDIRDPGVSLEWEARMRKLQAETHQDGR